MFSPTLPAQAHDAMVTVRSSACWIASTQVPCFSCMRLSHVLGWFFPADSAIGWREGGSPLPMPASHESKYFQLIYVRRVWAPTLEHIVHFYLEDIEHFYADDDPRLDFRYVMNHCQSCDGRLTDSKLFEPPCEGVFARRPPARENRISFRRCVGPISAIGCMVPIDNGLAMPPPVLAPTGSDHRTRVAFDPAGGPTRSAERGEDESRPVRQDGALRALTRAFGLLW